MEKYYGGQINKINGQYEIILYGRDGKIYRHNSSWHYHNIAAEFAAKIREILNTHNISPTYGSLASWGFSLVEGGK